MIGKSKWDGPEWAGEATHESSDMADVKSEVEKDILRDIVTISCCKGISELSAQA